MKLEETRSTKIMEIVTQLKTLDFVEKILDVRGMPDGFTVYVRGKDGNAYEFEIRAGAEAKGHEDLRKADKFAERKRKKKDQIRQRMGL